MEAPNLRVFSFSELMRATHNFKHTSILGEGSFGCVYKGCISVEETSPSTSNFKFIGFLNKLKPILRHQDHRRSNIHVVVKRLERVTSFQGFKEWQNEVAFLGSHSHPNLIKLLGYCCEDKELLLVYEYMPNRSLDTHLYNAFSPMEPLVWETRVSIALGVARGLAFLHAQDRPIIYRDLKSSDVLLDEKFNAKISDFGQAKLGPTYENSHVSTQVVGSSGICAPEYMCTGHLYVKSDVYMFGLVLVEILTGLRATHGIERAGQSTLERAKSCFFDKKQMKTIVDERLKENGYPLEEAFEMARLTLRCLQLDHKARPTMAEVVEILESLHRYK